MRISVVDKNQQSSSDAPHRYLNNPSILSLVSRREPEAQALLAQVRESRQELRCHCTDTPARMFIRYTHEFFTLVNHPEEGQHAPDCPLVTEIHGYGEREQGKVGAERDESNLDNFYMHREVRSGQAESPRAPSGNAKPSTAKEHKLDKLYRFMCDKTLGNWYYKNKRTRQTMMQILASFREKCQEVPFGDTVLSQWTYYGGNGFDFAKENLLRSIKQGSWNGRGRPHAFWFTFSNNVQFEQGYIVVDGVAYPYKSIIRPYAPANGPFFVCMTICVDNGNPCSHTIYLRPVVDINIPMPVDSQFERSVALAYIKWIDGTDTSQAKWSLNKPIYSRSVRDDSPCVLPDFVIQRKSPSGVLAEKYVLEVMGGRDEVYFERKSRLMPIMIDAWGANDLYEIHDLHSLPIINPLTPNR
ncbi:DUF1173 family protein [Vibrio sp. Hal054]|uniref:DUF1173 family protein n=1 Tax=Vibrio sp. Hal054 TaxID=3035158 RepID=UPI00301BA4F8